MKLRSLGLAPLFSIFVFVGGTSSATADKFTYSLASIQGVAGDYVTSLNGDLSDGCMVNVESHLNFDGVQTPLKRNWLINRGAVVELGRESGYTGQKTYQGMQYVTDISASGSVVGIDQREYPFQPRGMIWKGGDLR